MRLRVLVVERDPVLAAERARELVHCGYDAVGVSMALAAEVLMRESIDSIVCDDTLRTDLERIYGALIPVVPTAGQRTMQIAKTLARLTRRSMSPTVQLSIAAQLDRALATATLALEPVVDLRSGFARAHRVALVTPDVATDDLTKLAAELGRARELRRAVRELACDAIDRRSGPLVLECTMEDLMDPRLYEDRSPWASRAKSLLLSLSERDVLALAESDARDRLRTLRALGFELIVRIGADIAGLTSVGVVVPSYALIELAAFGNASPVVTRVVASIVAACREVSVEVIADVTTPEHVECARLTGCALAVGPAAMAGPSA
jgi:EAL domain-containing protein (putative c-di-GMP-specific phosphodiesterase class I)